MVTAELRSELHRLRRSRVEVAITAKGLVHYGRIISISEESIWVTKDETDTFIPLKRITGVSAVS